MSCVGWSEKVGRIGTLLVRVKTLTDTSSEKFSDGSDMRSQCQLGVTMVIIIIITITISVNPKYHHFAIWDLDFKWCQLFEQFGIDLILLCIHFPPSENPLAWRSLHKLLKISIFGIYGARTTRTPKTALLSRYLNWDGCGDPLLGPWDGQVCLLGLLLKIVQRQLVRIWKRPNGLVWSGPKTKSRETLAVAVRKWGWWPETSWLRT